MSFINFLLKYEMVTLLPLAIMSIPYFFDPSRTIKSRCIWLDILALGIGLPLLRIPSNFTTRTVFMWALIFSLFVRTIMQIFLYDIFALKENTPYPTTVQEILSSNYRIFFHGISSDSVFIDDVKKTLNTTNLEMMPIEDIELYLGKHLENPAFLLPEELVHYFLDGKKAAKWANKLHFVPQSAYTRYYKVYFRPTSVLTNVFNVKIQYFIQYGFTQKWEVDVFSSTFKNLDIAEKVKPLAVLDLLGIMIVYIFMTFLSLSVFVIEIVLRRF